MAKKARNSEVKTADYRHTGQKRKNIPPAKIAAEGKVPKVGKVRYEYSPHLPPVLRVDPAGKADKLPQLIAAAGTRPLNESEQRLLAEALRNRQPWLEWAGKREQHDRGFFDVDPVALHIHERISTQAILRAASREDVQRDLFADPQQSYAQAVQFYRHDVDWANRLVLGDSLQVMTSLARREELAGKIQMIYLDPPYGINFKSNFQSQLGQRDVKDRDQDLTREPEMVRAYRDTWTLGVHSYLAYLRDRLTAAKELLALSGSVFVQIGGDNLHRVRCLLDEIMGPHNAVSTVTVRKTATPSNQIDDGAFYVLWYARDIDVMKFIDLYAQKPCDEWARDTPGGSWGMELNGVRRSLTPDEKADVNVLPSGSHVYCLSKLTSAGAPTTAENLEALGQVFPLSQNEHWKTSTEGIKRLEKAHRLEARGRLWFTKFYDDGQFKRLSNVWTDTAGKSEESVYVVQTQPDVIQRCLLMTTDPGDIVVDPTCGGGTTAYVAEHWGRRWITCDTSRVALSLARQRLMTARFPYYQLRPLTLKDGQRNPHGAWLSDRMGQIGGKSTFACKTVPHITLKSIARNAGLDPIFEKHGSALADGLDVLNGRLVHVTAALRQKLSRKLVEKQKRDGKKAITEADRRRWELPQSEWREWEVPFDTDPDWPKPLTEALTAYRAVWRAKMDEVNACIAANAEIEELVDKPEEAKGIVRVTGPFTVEGVRPEELSLGEEGPFDPTPNEAEADGGAPEGVENVQSYLTQMVQHLRTDGLTFLNNQHRKLSRLDSLFEGGSGSLIHAEGSWNVEADEKDNAVAITFGPQHGPVTALQLEEAIRAAKQYDELVIAGFSFDAEAFAVAEEQSHPKLRVHLVQIRPDLNQAMQGLLKDTPNSQLFTVFGQPDVEVKEAKEGWICSLNGVEIYNPVDNTVRSSGADKVAAWFLDSDFDGRCFCITQAFFPDQNAWEKIAKALGGSADLVAFEAFKGTTSLPFTKGKYGRIAVKVIDPRGNEVMAIRKLS